MEKRKAAWERFIEGIKSLGAKNAGVDQMNQRKQRSELSPAQAFAIEGRGGGPVASRWLERSSGAPKQEARASQGGAALRLQKVGAQENPLCIWR